MTGSSGRSKVSTLSFLRLRRLDGQGAPQQRFPRCARVSGPAHPRTGNAMLLNYEYAARWKTRERLRVRLKIRKRMMSKMKIKSRIPLPEPKNPSLTPHLAPNPLHTLSLHPAPSLLQRLPLIHARYYPIHRRIASVRLTVYTTPRRMPGLRARTCRVPGPSLRGSNATDLPSVQ